MRIVVKTVLVILTFLLGATVFSFMRLAGFGALVLGLVMMATLAACGAIIKYKRPAQLPDVTKSNE